MVNFTEKQIGCVISILVLLILACIVLLMSFGSLEYTEIGLCHSWIGSSISDKGYKHGLHLIGFGNQFIAFPSTLVTIGFAQGRGNVAGPLESRTIDGLTVEIECSFQYQLTEDTIYEVYNKFGDEYHNIFVSLATEAITAEATKWTAAEWFHNITEIQVSMEGSMEHEFRSEANTQIVNFQLISVGLPSEYDTEIKRTEVARQDNKTAHAEYEVQETISQQGVEVAYRAANETNIAADAQAQAVLFDIDAWVTQYTLSQRLQAAEFAKIYNDLKANPALNSGVDASTGTQAEDELLKYLYARVIRDHPEDKSVVTRPALTATPSSVSGAGGMKMAMPK